MNQFTTIIWESISSNDMATLLSVLFVCLFCSSISYQERIQRISKLSEAHVNANKKCQSNHDCTDNEYCHALYGRCLRRCSNNSDCKMKEYCHNVWKICFSSQTRYKQLPTTSSYCRTSADCYTNQECHKQFNLCYTKSGTSTVRRDSKNIRRCVKSSECEENFYCHNNFRICLENSLNVTRPSTRTSKQCGPTTPCLNGMLCHNLWNICYSPSKVLTLPQKNKTQQCQIDSDCKTDEFCHTVLVDHIVARQKCNVQRLCLSRKFQQPPKRKETITCKTDTDCAMGKCCLKNLGVCMVYKMPGEICFTAQTNLVCGCNRGSYCKSRGKLPSPRRIINEMKLPQTAVIQLRSNRKKYKIGRCTLLSL